MRENAVGRKDNKGTRETIRVMSDANANLFNVKCMAMLSALAVLTEILNELGLFKVNRAVMIPAMSIAFSIFILPVAVYLFTRKTKEGETPVIERAWFRKLIIICGFAGAVMICVSLSFHAVVFMAVPILIAAQYGNHDRWFVWVLIASLILVPVGVYGSFFFGAPDRNFIKGALTDEEAMIFANRLKIATPQRMFEIFLHYVLPRLFGVTAVAFLAGGISRRNSKMSEKQIELTEQVIEEMDHHREMQTRVIELLANVIETRDVSTGMHIIHTKRYVGLISDAMSRDDKYKDIMTDVTIERMTSAAPLHDVGKIIVPDTILLKPGRLTEEEFEKMKTHTSAGGKLIRDFFSGIDDEAFLKTAEEIAVAHHEKWDGSGYPCGLKGEEIPLSARVMAVADVFDALVSVRVYKDSIAPEDALAIIYSESGTHFDPDIIRIVRTIERDMIAVANSLTE